MNVLLKKIGFGALIATAPILTFLGAAEAGDADAGAKIFKRCLACHAVGPDAKNKVGPTLNGIVGRAAGIKAGYSYGTGIIEARGAVGEDTNGDGLLDVPEGFTGLTWTEENLAAYIENPKGFLQTYTNDKEAKAKMVFQLKGADDRANVIAYLKTFGPDGNPAAQ